MQRVEGLIFQSRHGALVEKGGVDALGWAGLEWHPFKAKHKSWMLEASTLLTLGDVTKKRDYGSLYQPGNVFELHRKP